jgi:hypothetical protein
MPSYGNARAASGLSQAEERCSPIVSCADTWAHDNPLYWVIELKALAGAGLFNQDRFSANRTFAARTPVPVASDPSH